MDEKHKKIKKTLKTVGLVLLIIGIALDIVGIVDFFSCFGTGGFPHLFWTLFVGLPLTGIGFWLLLAGNIHEIHKYTMNESKENTKDYANYMMKETRQEVVNTVDALKDDKKEIICPSCGDKIPSDSTFCPNCGKKLNKTCPDCGTSNEPDAKFCKKCGKRLS